MKKTISLLLAIVLLMSCMPFATGIIADAADFETAHGVQVEIAPFLYKSTLYQMHFPNPQTYEIKETSTPGDYAISGELNDLSYVFTFPAGTTEIRCELSLNGETNWRGVRLNSTQNPTYWEQDEDGNVDYSKPMTFARSEIIAECDEYGVLYRDYLKDADVGGFRDYDKVYWRLIYTCNGEEYTDYFDIKLYDYDASEKYALSAVNFNVAGLPFAALQGVDLAATQKSAAAYLSGNGFDIVAAQEDFGYHQTLVDNLYGFNYMTHHMGSVPGGDGLSIFTKDMPVYNEQHVTWKDACGILTDGSDELTAKGFLYSVIDVGNGIYVDFYNLHADAYAGAGSKAARTSQFKQLAEFIQARSAEHARPVIVTGDFNYHIHTHEDDGSLYKTLYQQCGLQDAWVEYHNDGDYFNMYKWHISGLKSWGNWDSVERFMYKGGGGVDLVVSDFRYTEVCDANGEVISDHNAAECEFTFIKTEDFVENTQELQVGKAPDTGFMYQIKWIFKALMLVLSEIDKLPELLKELTA